MKDKNDELVRVIYFNGDSRVFIARNMTKLKKHMIVEKNDGQSWCRSPREQKGVNGSVEEALISAELEDVQPITIRVI